MVRFRRTETVSIIIQSSVIKGKIRLFNNVIKCFLKKKINARHNATFPQILANFPASLNGAKRVLRHYLNKTKVNKKKKFRTKREFFLTESPLEKSTKANIKKTPSYNKNVTQSNFQVKVAGVHDASYRLLLSGDVETNPGPNANQQTDQGTDRGGKKRALNAKESYDRLDVITYNCRGLKMYTKLKRVLNTCSDVLKRNRLSLIFIQETHLERESERRIRVMWRGGFALSPGEGGSRGCLILFDSSWQCEEKFECLDGRLACVVIQSGHLSIIAICVYAPNNHDVLFFEDLFNKLIELKDKYPEHQIIIAGDFNLVLNRGQDSINRADSNLEKVIGSYC